MGRELTLVTRMKTAKKLARMLESGTSPSDTGSGLKLFRMEAHMKVITSMIIFTVKVNFVPYLVSSRRVSLETDFSMGEPQWSSVTGKRSKGCGQITSMLDL